VELDKLEILVGETSTGYHSHTVTSASVSGCATEVSTSVSSGGQDGVLSKKPVDCAVFLIVRDYALANAVFHDQIRSEEFDEVLSVVSQRLAVERV
jgi:hypothetical protein